MRKYSKRTIAAVAAVTVAGSGLAFAYWTAGGTGTGSAATGTTVPITAVQTSTVTAMAPGVAAQTLAGNFNNTNSGPVYVSTVSVAISSITKAGVAVTGCTSADYTLVQPTAVNAEVANGTGVGSWGGGSIAFKNLAANQDACKGVTVNLNYTIA